MVEWSKDKDQESDEFKNVIKAYKYVYELRNFEGIDGRKRKSKRRSIKKSRKIKNNHL